MSFDSELIRTLYETACHSGAALGGQPGLARRGAERLELSLDGLDLRACVTPEAHLDVSVRVEAWNPEVEKALYDALDRSDTLVAGLLLWEWHEVRRACVAASRQHAA